MEHTPKNILLRAVKEKEGKGKDTKVQAMTEFLNVTNTLQKILSEKNNQA